MPKLDGILETAIHTEDMVRARAFYEGVLGLEPIYSDNRLSAYAVAGRDVLLVFRKGTTRETVTLPSGTIPAMVVMVCCMWPSPSARTNSTNSRKSTSRRSDFRHRCIYLWHDPGSDLRVNGPVSRRYHHHHA